MIARHLMSAMGLSSTLSRARSAGTEERLAARAMMGRIGAPEDIAMRWCFCFTESDWITAQVLTVDSERMDYIGRRWRVTAPTSVCTLP